MAHRVETIVCQRCGTGFILTETYRQLLERRGVRVLHPRQCPTCFVARGPLPKIQGFVKWFNPRKHYGFLVADDGREVFVHQRQLVGDDPAELRAGSQVRFHVHHPPKGPEAINVELVPDLQNR